MRRESSGGRFIINNLVVNLKIKVPNGCSLEIDDTAKTNFNCEKESETSTTYIVGASEFSTGAYPVKFTVKKSVETVHIFIENINVINGLCTDTWGGLEKGEAKEITQSMISNTVYVRGENAPWYTSNAPSATASDEENTYVGTNGMADFSASTTQDLKLTIKALSETAKATLDAGGASRANCVKRLGFNCQNLDTF